MISHDVNTINALQCTIGQWEFHLWYSLVPWGKFPYKIQLILHLGRA